MPQMPGFWDDPKKAEELLREISQVKSWTEDFRKVDQGFEDLQVIFDFYREGEAQRKMSTSSTTSACR